MTVQAAPGVILAVWTGTSLPDELIRIGAVLRGRPGVANHVAIITHQDARGRWIGIQGQPGGVGPVDVTHWLTDSRTRGTYAQPRPNDEGQTAKFLATCAKSLGISYDWAGIAEDVAQAVGADNLAEAIDPLWRWPTDHDLLPGHVVCSSLAAMACARVLWGHPGPGHERTVTPADWWDWADREQWKGQS